MKFPTTILCASFPT